MIRGIRIPDESVYPDEMEFFGCNFGKRSCLDVAGSQVMTDHEHLQSVIWRTVNHPQAASLFIVIGRSVREI